MLEYLRNASEKPIAKILIGILAFSFVGWGVAEWIFGGAASDTTLVRVGNAEVSVQEFSTEKSRQLSTMTKDQQRVVYTDAAAGNEFTNKVLTTLATQRMAENRAADLGFFVTDGRIAREVRTFQEFQLNGQFSTFMFDSVLRNSGLSESDFAAFLRSQVLRSMVLGGVSVPMNVPQFAVNAAYNARYGQRKINYVPVSINDFKVENPSDDQLRQFYATRPHVIPEHRSASYVLIPAEMSQPDKYDAAYAIAQRVEDDVIAGETMATAAKAHKVKFVNLGDFTAEKHPVDKILTDAMIARIFDMDEGLESELIETKDGFLIVRVDKIIPSHNAEFDSVKKNLVKDWKIEEQKKQAYVRANELLVDLNKDGKLKGAKAVTVSRTSGAPVEVLSAAFNNAVGTNTIVPGTDAFYVLHVDNEISPKVDTKKMADLRKELQEMSTRMAMDDYNAFLMREYPVRINEKVYNRFFGKR